MARNDYRATSYLEDSVQPHHGAQPGLVGLSNLDNTCFMNSSLQCLAHTAPLVSYFLTGQYRTDINPTNPLGMKGELADSLARLVNHLWQPNVGCVTPHAFKAKIDHFAPQLSGDQQHDSKEFLAFLLNGLHEDLNRIRSKPHIEEKDIPGRSDTELAEEAWANCRRQKDSIVADHFQGLCKYTLDCPQCCNATTKFDPFMYLSLPLPGPDCTRTLAVCVLAMDGSTRPMMYSVEVAKSGTVKDWCCATAKVAALQLKGNVEAHLLAAKVSTSLGNWNQSIACLDPRARLAEVLELSPRFGELCVIYYYPDAACGPQSGLEQVTVSQRRKTWNSFASSGSGCMGFYATPLVMFVPSSELPGSAHVFKLKSSYTSKFLINPAASMVSRVHAVLSPFRLAPLPQSIPPLPQPIREADDDDTLDPGIPEAREGPSTAQLDAHALSGQDQVVPQSAVWIDDDDYDDDLHMPDREDGDAILVPPIPPNSPRHNSRAGATGVTSACGQQNHPDDSSAEAPFDMWLAQKGTAASLPAVHWRGDDDAPTSAPFHMYMSSDKNMPEFYSYSKPVLGGHRSFVLDWVEPQSPMPDASETSASWRYDLDALSSPEEHDGLILGNKRVRAGPRPVDLFACMVALLQPEQLSKEDSWYCPRCKMHVQVGHPA